ncbi:mucin-2-like [Halichondria panicea]|uniref:mucin-2-like n=1 Tax=Halichondria panicea TaxID=6063 RepID=UPI00312B8C4A
MQVQAVIISIQLFSLAAATLISTPPVVCPDDTVTFTCTLPGSLIRWTVTPPQGQMFLITLSTSNTEDTQGNPAFRGVLTDSSGGMLTATLTSLSETSIVEGTMVLCEGASSQEGPLTITVADPPSPPLNPRVSSTQNQPSSSIITLEWDPPSSTGGVSVMYVLTISPTPLSESPVTVETTSAQITVLYSIPYNVTTRAVNCAGMSQEGLIVDLILCPTPSTAAGVTMTNTPPVTIGGSMLTFTCSGDSEVITSTCGNNGWSPDPGTFDCGTPVTGIIHGCTIQRQCGHPFSLGSEVTFHCDEGLFPPNVRTSTCTDVGGRGEWVENPESLVCREKPVNCTVPAEPCNGAIVDYESLNETVSEGTVLTYRCDNGFSLTGPNTIACTNARI